MNLDMELTLDDLRNLIKIGREMAQEDDRIIAHATERNPTYAKYLGKRRDEFIEIINKIEKQVASVNIKVNLTVGR